MSIVCCAATAAVPAAAPRFAGLRRVAGPAALNRDVEQPSAVSLQVSERPVRHESAQSSEPPPVYPKDRKYPGRDVSRKREIFPRSRAPIVRRDARRGGASRPRIPSIAVDRFFAFHLFNRPVRPFSPRDHVLTSSEPRSRPPPQVSGRSNSRASRRCVATMAGTGRFVVGGNWKCNGNTASIQKLVQDLNAGEITADVEVICAPP